MSKYNDDCYLLNCLDLFRTKIKLESHKKLYENKDFCNIVMLSEETKLLEFNQLCKFDKALFVIYGDLGSLMVKIDGFKNNLEKSSTIKVSEHILSGFSMSTISSFKDIENKHKYKDCMKIFVNL